jgi:general secretion pathway protein I
MAAKASDSHAAGFTLLEIMISLAIIGGLLVTLIYTLNYHLGLAGRQEFYTVASLLAREKIVEMERKPVKSNGGFPEPNSAYQYTNEIKASRFQGMSEISVIVSNGKEYVKLEELIQSPR